MSCTIYEATQGEDHRHGKLRRGRKRPTWYIMTRPNYRLITMAELREYSCEFAMIWWAYTCRWASDRYYPYSVIAYGSSSHINSQAAAFDWRYDAERIARELTNMKAVIEA